MTRGRSSTGTDVNQLIRDSWYQEIDNGKTKHEYHAEARQTGLKQFHDISAETPFKNSKTLSNNKAIIKNIDQFIRAEYKCPTIRDCTPQMIADYLDRKIDVDKVQSSTFFRTICPAVNNLQAMLDRVDVKVDFQDVLKSAKERAFETCTPPDRSSRNYDADDFRAEQIIDNVSAEIPQFCLHLQLEYGLRANESYKIHLTDKPNQMEIHQKGGRRTIKDISPADYGKLVELSDGKTNYYISNYQQLQYHFSESCKGLGIESNGMHGLRATFACRLYDRLTASGYNDTDAKAQISVELGHERPEIVNEYLRGR